MIQHSWSEKSLKMLRMTAAERKKQPKLERTPEEDAEAATYRTDDGEYGVPILAFKAAMISAAHKDLGIEKTVVRKSLFIPPIYGARNIARMETDAPTIREDLVRIGAGTTDIRYRPMFDNWAVKMVIQIDSDLLTEQDVVNLINRAGFSVGVGEWRPEKGGEFGRFELDLSHPIKIISNDDLEKIT
ncbi:MAG: hypothetical protein GY750_07210 [Lentisphaerae bacterium]|nr:hypothetical protein [Lentisphaerota bacterium]